MGEMELQNYAKNTLLRVIEQEEGDESRRRMNGGPCESGLRHMARLDIGIIYNLNTRKFSFWLNEIERGHCTGLWSKVNWEGFLRFGPTMVLMWENMITKYSK